MSVFLVTPLSNGISIGVPVTGLPSTTTMAACAALSGLMSIVSLPGLGSTAFDAVAGGGCGGLTAGLLGVDVELVVSAAGPSSRGLTPLLTFTGSASCLVPSPNSRPQNTPIASPAETTIGTMCEVPCRTAWRGIPIAPIGPIGPIGCIEPPIGG
ncbi:MAG: hypothetical protein E6J90_07560 [Deltaproteobacteria bacterium]|nr:MAG: hypothetical protein E6J90_07560 [Deltaproteobacteria bacterium]